MMLGRASWILIASLQIASAPPKTASKAEKPEPARRATPIEQLRVAGWSVELTPPGTPYLAIAVGPPRPGGPSVVTVSSLPEGVIDALAAPDAADRLAKALAAGGGPLKILQVSPPKGGRSWEVSAMLPEEKPPRIVQFIVVPGEPGNLVTLVTAKGVSEKVADALRAELARSLAGEARLSTRKQ